MIACRYGIIIAAGNGTANWRGRAGEFCGVELEKC